MCSSDLHGPDARRLDRARLAAGHDPVVDHRHPGVRGRRSARGRGRQSRRHERLPCRRPDRRRRERRARRLQGGSARLAAALVGGVPGWWLVPFIAAPVVGHCWSPWLRLRGGKGVAPAYGTLMPVTFPWGIPLLPLTLVLAWRTVSPDGWAPVLACGLAVVALLVAGALPAAVGAAVVLGIIILRYRDDLAGGIARRRAGTAA